jgi:hypothetical protein
MAAPDDPAISQAPADDQTSTPITDAEALSTPETSEPMLDVHAPHEPIHTWKSFFIHIATIVIGLLIAVGLEQTVEYVHHRHLASEARANIQQELIQNASLLQQNIDRLRADQQSLEKNLELLDASTPDAQTILALQYSWVLRRIADAAWTAARTDGSIALIPSKEILLANYFYSSSIEMVPLYYAYFTDIDTASAIVDHCRTIGKLTPSERDQLRTLTTSAVGRSRILSFILSSQVRALKQTNLDPK